MQDEKQGVNQRKTEKRNTGGLPIARDATQLGNARNTPESRGDREDHPGNADQDRERNPPPAPP